MPIRSGQGFLVVQVLKVQVRGLVRFGRQKGFHVLFLQFPALSGNDDANVLGLIERAQVGIKVVVIDLVIAGLRGSGNTSHNIVANAEFAFADVLQSVHGDLIGRWGSGFVVAVKSETGGSGDTLAYLFFVGINVADVVIAR